MKKPQIKKMLQASFLKQFGVITPLTTIQIEAHNHECSRVVFWIRHVRYTFKSVILNDGTIWIPARGIEIIDRSFDKSEWVK